MAHMIIRHKFADFANWKSVYDDHRSAREALDLKDVHLWRNADDRTEVILLFEASDVAKAKEFAGSSGLKERLRAAGVQGSPDIVFLSED